jgi:predicted MFS family arabinose efflux permease
MANVSSAVPAPPAGRMTLLALCVTVFALLVHGAAAGPLNPEIARDLQTSFSKVGQINTVIFFMMAVSGLLVGPLADHFGPKRTILSCLTVVAVSAIGSALAPSFPVLLAISLVVGVGATIWGVCFGVAATLFAGEGQRRALSRVQAAQTSGTILGALLLTVVAALTSWRGAYVAVCVGYLIAITLVARGLPADRPIPRERFSLQTVLTAYRPLLGDRRMALTFTGGALRAVGWMGPLAFVGAFYADRHGLSLRQIGLAYTASGLGVLAGNLLAGERLKRFGLRQVYVVSTPFMGIAWVVVFLLPVHVLVVVAAMAAGSLVSGLGWVCYTNLLARETRAGAGTTMGFNGSTFMFGAASGAAVCGGLLSLSGYAAIGIAMPLFILASALLVWLPDRRPAEALLAPEPVTPGD